MQGNYSLIPYRMDSRKRGDLCGDSGFPGACEGIEGGFLEISLSGFMLLLDSGLCYIFG